MSLLEVGAYIVREGRRLSTMGCDVMWRGVAEAIIAGVGLESIIEGVGWAIPLLILMCDCTLTVVLVLALNYYIIS